MQPPVVSVLVVDDHPALRAGLEQLLDQEPGYRLLGAVSSEAELAIALRRQRPDVVVHGLRADARRWSERLLPPQAAPAIRRASSSTPPTSTTSSRSRDARPGRRDVSKNASRRVLLDAIDAVAAGERSAVARPRSHRGRLVADWTRRGSADRRHAVREGRGSPTSRRPRRRPRRCAPARSASSARCRRRTAGTVTPRCEPGRAAAVAGQPRGGQPGIRGGRRSSVLKRRNPGPRAAPLASGGGRLRQRHPCAPPAAPSAKTAAWLRRVRRRRPRSGQRDRSVRHRVRTARSFTELSGRSARLGGVAGPAQRTMGPRPHGGVGGGWGCVHGDDGPRHSTRRRRRAGSGEDPGICRRTA